MSNKTLQFPLRRLAPAALALVLTGAVHAQEQEVPASSRSFQVSGFATLAVTHNDNGAAGIVNSSAQKRPAGSGMSGVLDTVGGLHLSWQPLADTMVVAQGVARAGDDFEPELRLGYVRQALGRQFAVRVGRIRSPLFFDSDVSEIGYAYLMMRPPIPLYGMVNSVASLDGVDLQWRDAFGDAAVMVQGYYGASHYTHRFYNLDPVVKADADLKDVRGLAVSVNTPSLLVRASRTWIRSYTMESSQVDQLNAGAQQLAYGLQGLASNPLLPAGMAGALQQQGSTIAGYTNIFDSSPIYTSIGFDANVDNWRLLGEYTYLKSGSEMVGNYKGFQLTAGYAFGNFTPYLSYARQRRSSDLLDTSAFNATGVNAELDAGLGQMKGALDEAAHYADITMSSISLGVRYDFRENMALKFQYDYLKAPNGMSPGYFAVSGLPYDNHVNLVSLALDLTF